MVFQEAHADGEPHFHVAVKLSKTMRWGSVKRAMRERFRVACHFSSSHTQLWSCIRYGFVASAKKPDVDQTPFMWTGGKKWPTGLVKSGSTASKLLWEASQRPWNAECWAARSAQTQKHMAETGKDKAKCDKLDLFAVILDNNFTKAAQIIAHAQESGTEAMQKFVCKNMKELERWVAEAEVWGAAVADAQSLMEKDWAVACRHAEAACPCEGECAYENMSKDPVGPLGIAPPSGFGGALDQPRRVALPSPPRARGRGEPPRGGPWRTLQAFFTANKNTLSRNHLATALRAIIVEGPAKTRLTPMLVGPSNTGKSTLVMPFVKLFGFHSVFHKPAGTSAPSDRARFRWPAGWGK